MNGHRNTGLRCGIAGVAVFLCLHLPARSDAPSRRDAESRNRDRSLVVCIGLDRYREDVALKRAETDAMAMAGQLQKLGFRVLILINAEVTVDNVNQALQRRPVLTYFAGHAQRGELVLRDGTLSLDAVAPSTDVILLDGCTVGRELAQRGRTRVYAAARDYAFEDARHGLFTRYVIEWLRGGNALCGPGMAAFLAKHVARETGGWQQTVYGYFTE